MHQHTYSTNDFLVGEAAYNKEEDKQTCPQVGCTVFRYKKSTRCVIDKLGGAVGTYFGDQMDTFSNNPEDCNKVDAICFSGGSLEGLTPAAGVAQTLFEENIKTPLLNKDGSFILPIVKGAITSSGAWGKVKKWKAPDSTLGKLAMEDAKKQLKTVHFGQHGAGSNAEVGSILTGAWGAAAGQGAYCTKNDKGFYCAVYCNINAKGAIIGEDGALLYGPKEENGTFYGNMFRSTNFLIHTNAKCKSIDLMRQLARQVHVSAAKIIFPYATHSDGDVLFLTSSEEKETEDTTELGVFFSECLWKAVYAMVGHYTKNKNTVSGLKM